MRLVITLLTAGALLGSGSGTGNSRADQQPVSKQAAGQQPADGKGAPQKRRIVRPGVAVPAVAAVFLLRVQKEPRFAKEEHPPVSQAVSRNGLTLTVQPEKKKFAGNGPLAFAVTLKNTSPGPLRLPAAETLGGRPRLVISNRKTAAQWTISGKLALGKPLTLKPGEAVTRYVVVEAPAIVPRPVPLPQPRPLPRPGPQPRRLPPVRKFRIQQGTNPQPAQAVVPQRAAQRVVNQPQIAPPVGRPIRPPIVVPPTLPCGQGPCTARLFLEFVKPQQAAEGNGLWTGKIASAPFSFEVGKPEFWTPGQPLTKTQAVRLAHPVAERALSAAYRPVPGLRPPKTGPWIESPEKTATAKKDKNGNWTVSWTRFPKTGHAYNITLLVSRFGGVSVREVFTGYSKGR